MAAALTRWLAVCFITVSAPAFGVETPNAIPRPEHPRPDLQRADWLNLNGTWEFEIDAAGDGEQRELTSGHALARSIRVPFCPESELSGIGETDFMTHVWYRRSFEVPPSWRGRRVLLHFGAVDWQARVWLNGTWLGEHCGGYAPFTFEITPALRNGANELVLHVIDDTRSGKQATGKQSQKPESHGCVYTRTTGIWQTVWLEAVGETYLRDICLTPDLDNGRFYFQGGVEGPPADAVLRLRAYAGERLVGEENVRVSGRVALGVVQLTEVTPWSPERPFLYDVTAVLERREQVLDRVRTYGGLRKLTIEGNRFLINDQALFQRLVLDQGFYPDGIYTAPTDEALRHDIELAMAAGFNGARLHQKVFEPRFLYWADKLGYLVWGEYPNWGLSAETAESFAHVLDEWRTILQRDRSHPALIGWCPLNETGGSEAIAALQSLLAVTQTVDPTRPFLDASGWVHLYPGTDVYDAHDYTQDPADFAAHFALFARTGTELPGAAPGDPRGRYRGQPFFVSEYGGMRLKTERNPGSGWGYGETDLQEFLARYRGLTDALLDNPNMFGFCYTQLTDIEQEQNGIYFYDRTPKYDPALVKVINERRAAYETQAPVIVRLNWRPLADTSRATPQAWRYTTTAPAADWAKPGFEDRAWSEGPGGFGRAGTPGAIIGTTWQTDDIWLRRTFAVETNEFEFAYLDIHHDEDAEVYVNGERVAQLSGWTTAYTSVDATDAVRRALVPGPNTLAVHCHQRDGGQYIDVGLRVAHAAPTR
jgi:hypothetical protein